MGRGVVAWGGGGERGAGAWKVWGGGTCIGNGGSKQSQKGKRKIGDFYYLYFTPSTSSPFSAPTLKLRIIRGYFSFWDYYWHIKLTSEYLEQFFQNIKRTRNI